MALAKEGYTPALRGTTKVNIPIDESGYIVPEGGNAASTKTFTITAVSAENSLTDNTDVLSFFLQLANGQQDSLSNTMSVKWEV